MLRDRRMTGLVQLHRSDQPGSERQAWAACACQRQPKTVPDLGTADRREEPIADGHHGCLEYPRLDFTRVSHIHMPELHRPFG